MSTNQHGNKPNTELRRKALELSRKGLGIKRIARELGCSTKVARSARVAAGLPTWIGPRGGWQLEERAKVMMRDAFILETEAVKKEDKQWFQHVEFSKWYSLPSYWRSVEASRRRGAQKAKERYHRLKHEPNFKLKRTLRFRVWKACKDANGYKSKRTEELVGCNWSHLKAHIESQFKRGMSWHNHGEWHVDHIIPCASFDLSDPKQQRICFHFTNLQPLWARDNMSKSDKIPPNPQMHLCI